MRRNWLLSLLMVMGGTYFLLTRTVWGPPSKAAANEPSPQLSDSERRYIQDQPNHWRTMMIKQH